MNIQREGIIKIYFKQMKNKIKNIIKSNVLFLPGMTVTFVFFGLSLSAQSIDKYETELKSFMANSVLNGDESIKQNNIESLKDKSCIPDEKLSQSKSIARSCSFYDIADNVSEQKISISGQGSAWSYYGVHSDSPDGRRLIYTVYTEPLYLERKELYYYPAELWVCNADGTDHQRLWGGCTLIHNGLHQSWVDNHHIAFCAQGNVMVINADTGNMEYGPFEGYGTAHCALDGKVLLISQGKGIYELDIYTGKIKMVMSYANSNIMHLQYSPDGNKLLFTTAGNSHLVIANIDGSELTILPGLKPMHFQWFDNRSFFGYSHEEVVGIDLRKHHWKEMYRFDLNGQVMEHMSGHGCHGVIRRDGMYIAGESWYGSDPIELYLYHRGEREPLATIFSHSFTRMVWDIPDRHHVNPSFSRCGRYLYYNKAVSENITYAYRYDLKGLVEPMKLEKVKQPKMELVLTDQNTVTDIEGNTYSTVAIGNQLWMAENLRVTHYRNGDSIPTGLTYSEWLYSYETDQDAYSVYPYDQIEGINSEEEVLDKYGALYNWYAVIDHRRLCPAGWDVPTDREWQTLIDHLAGESSAGGKLKSINIKKDSQPGWNSPNTGATNETGFSALPGGRILSVPSLRDPYRQGKAQATSIGNEGFWWSSTGFSALNAYLLHMEPNSSYINRYITGKNFGYSVRCVKRLD